jgi:hypothetical protein
VQKLRAQEMKEEERDRDRWFNQERPMQGTKRMWKQERIKREEDGSDSGDNTSSKDTHEPLAADVNMVFQLPSEFCLPEPELAQLALGLRGQCSRSRKRSGNT